ncbi:hypothetical protein C8R45DRAFT_1097120 [Mycena sanguinolenta]|nr:hypothetical protein C8R45DRAFT_1097120 [Mycena sanguinolenta]
MWVAGVDNVNPNPDAKLNSDKSDSDLQSLAQAQAQARSPRNPTSTLALNSNSERITSRPGPTLGRSSPTPPHATATACVRSSGPPPLGDYIAEEGAHVRYAVERGAGACILAHAPFFAVAKASIQFLLDVDATCPSNGSNSSNGARTKHTARKKTLTLRSIDDARAEYWARSGGPLTFALARMLRGEPAYLSELTREHRALLLSAKRKRSEREDAESAANKERGTKSSVVSFSSRACCAFDVCSAESDRQFYTSHKPASSPAAVPTSMSVLVSGAPPAPISNSLLVSPPHHSHRTHSVSANPNRTATPHPNNKPAKSNPNSISRLDLSARADLKAQGTAPAWLACVDAVDEGEAQHQQQNSIPNPNSTCPVPVNPAANPTSKDKRAFKLDSEYKHEYECDYESKCDDSQSRTQTRMRMRFLRSIQLRP